MKKAVKTIMKELITLAAAIFLMWMFASWVDTVAHNGPNGDLHFWKYNAFVILTEMR